MVKTAAILFGVVFLFIGILGFVPAATPANGMLLGIFHVNTAHNIVHLQEWCFCYAAWPALVHRGYFSGSSEWCMRSWPCSAFIMATSRF